MSESQEGFLSPSTVLAENEQAKAEDASAALKSLTQKLENDSTVTTFAASMGTSAESVALGVMKEFKDLNGGQFGVAPGKDIELREQLRAEADAKLGNTTTVAPVDLSAGAKAVTPEKPKEEKPETVEEFLAGLDKNFRKKAESRKAKGYNSQGVTEYINTVYTEIKPLAEKIGHKYYPQYVAMREKREELEKAAQAYLDGTQAVPNSSYYHPDDPMLKAVADAKADAYVEAQKELVENFKTDPLIAELHAKIKETGTRMLSKEASVDERGNKYASEAERMVGKWFTVDSLAKVALEEVEDLDDKNVRKHEQAGYRYILYMSSDFEVKAKVRYEAKKQSGQNVDAPEAPARTPSNTKPGQTQGAGR